MDLIIDGYNLLALNKRLDCGLEQSRNSLITHLALPEGKTPKSNRRIRWLAFRFGE